MNSSTYRFKGLFYREPGKFGRTPDRLFDVPWEQSALERIFPELVLEDKEATQMWAAISLLPGATRGNAAVDQVFAVILDKDCADVGDLDRTRSYLVERGQAFAILTSHSHRRAGKVHAGSGRTGPFDCFRVVLPVSRPMNSEEYRRVHAAVFATLTVPPDPERYSFEVAGKYITQRNGVQSPCKPRGWDPTADQPARPWFLPCAPQETASHALLEVYEGKTLDVDHLLKLPGINVASTRVYSDEPPSEGARALFYKVAEAFETAGFPLSNTDPEANCRATCPVCQDVSPSLTVHAKGERVVMNCFAGCATKDVLAATGLSFRDLETEVLTDAKNAVAAAEMQEFRDFVENRANAAIPERTSELREDEEAIQRAFGSDRTTPYTPDELQDMAPVKKRWVLGTTAGYFLRAPGGDYIGPFTRELLPTKARDILAPAWTADVRLKELTDKGDSRLLSMAEIMDRYGQVPSRMCYSYTVERSGLDDSLTFVQRAARPRSWAPEYNPQIDKWLRLFAGSDQQAEALMDWLATIMDLSRPTASICIMGTSGAGKDLFADGLREIWGARMAFHHALDHFNGGLIDSPLVFANEEVKAPRDFKGSVAEALKEMIASDSRSVQNKYAHAVDLYGAVRVVIATNSQGVLKFDRQPNSDDIQALEDRIILLRPNDACREYIISIGGRDTTEAWVRGGGLAKHVMWLQLNRKVKPGPRFLVQGSGGMAEVLAADGRGAATVLRAYLTALLGPVAVEPKVAHYWEGDFWFSPRNLKDRWNTYGGKDVFPEDMAAVTSVICEPEVRGEKPKQRKVAGDPIRMRRIKWPVLLRAAQAEDRLDELLGLKAEPPEIK